jgi:two-component system sensor histidine kinase KdpD
MTPPASEALLQSTPPIPPLASGPTPDCDPSLLTPMIMHEIRNSMTIMGLGLETLEKLLPKQLPQEQAPAAHLSIARLQRQVRGMVALSYTISALAAHRAGRAPRPLEAILIRSFLESTIQDRARTLLHRISVDGDGDADATVLADRRLLTTVTGNLLDNALKYSDAPVQVTVGSLQHRILIRIADHGKGVPPGDLARILRPFIRGGNTHGTDGMGLGLLLVQHCLEVMNSQILYQDTPGGGATFGFLLQRRFPPFVG